MTDKNTKAKDMAASYKEYLESDDKEVRIDGTVFHKVIRKDALDLKEIGRKLLIVCVSNKLAARKGSTVIDDLSNEFTVYDIVHYTYQDIPEWFGEVTSLAFENLDSEDVGDFLALKETGTIKSTQPIATTRD